VPREKKAFSTIRRKLDDHQCLHTVHTISDASVERLKAVRHVIILFVITASFIKQIQAWEASHENNLNVINNIYAEVSSVDYEVHISSPGSI